MNLYDDDATDAEPHTRPAVTGEETRTAIERVARLNHLVDQADAASLALGQLVGAFASGLLNNGLSEDFATDLSHHYLDLLLPPPPSP